MAAVDAAESAGSGVLASASCLDGTCGIALGQLESFRGQVSVASSAVDFSEDNHLSSPKP